MPKKFKRGQVWQNPEDVLMLVTAAVDCHRNVGRAGREEQIVKTTLIEYVTEAKERGRFFADDLEIISNITLYSQPVEGENNGR